MLSLCILDTLLNVRNIIPFFRLFFLYIFFCLVILYINNYILHIIFMELYEKNKARVFIIENIYSLFNYCKSYYIK